MCWITKEFSLGNKLLVRKNRWRPEPELGVPGCSVAHRVPRPAPNGKWHVPTLLFFRHQALSMKQFTVFNSNTVFSSWRMNYITMLKRKKTTTLPPKTIFKGVWCLKIHPPPHKAYRLLCPSWIREKTFRSRYMGLSHKKEMPTQESWAGLFMSDGCRFGHPRDEQMPISESQRALSWVFIIQIQSFPK